MPRISAKKLESYRKIFEQCDVNKNNVISLRELKAFLRVRRHSRYLPEDKLRQIFKLADKDGSKQLNFDEFIYILEHPDIQLILRKWMNNYIQFIVPHSYPSKKYHPRSETIEDEDEVVLGESIPLRVFSRKVGGVEEEEKEETQKGETEERKKEQEEGEIEVEEEEEKESEGGEEEDLEGLYEDEHTCCPPPIAMIIFSVLEFIFFLTDEIIRKNINQSYLAGEGTVAHYFAYIPSQKLEIWRFLTYMFVHTGRYHLIGNLAVQLILGVPLEMVHKWWRVSLVYFSGVIAGSLATSVADPCAKLAGASGGVYAIITAYIGTVLMNWSEMTNPLVILIFFGVYVGFDLRHSIINRYNSEDQVAYFAHIGGAAAGLLTGIYILRNLNVRVCEKYLWWIALTLYVILMLTTIFLNLFLPISC